MSSGNRRCCVALFSVLLFAWYARAQSMKMESKHGTAQAAPGRTRTYYIAADDLVWDYVRSGVNAISGQPFQSLGLFANPSHGVKPLEKPVSTACLKTLYREYIDESFETLKPRSPEWEHLGFLGPPLGAEVGDTVKVVFRKHAT